VLKWPGGGCKAGCVQCAEATWTDAKMRSVQRQLEGDAQGRRQLEFSWRVDGQLGWDASVAA
jgi:hypothetical protein